MAIKHNVFIDPHHPDSTREGYYIFLEQDNKTSCHPITATERGKDIIFS
jgi:hypothetical protein